MIIPWQQIPAETLQNLIEYYILREGTDYGDNEIPLAEKVEQIRQQLSKGTIVITYSELHETVSLQPRDALLSD